MPHILVVDDSPDVVMLAKTILESAGHQVSTSPDGRQALKLLGIEPPDPSKATPDLVLLDIMMPGIDGLTVGTMIQSDPRTQGVPVIIITAAPHLSNLYESLIKIERLVPKPFKPEELIGAVDDVLKKKQAQR
jgi:CheY-like chemotaxis protein